MSVPATQPARGWVLYDDECDVCRRLSARWESTLQKHGFDLAPLQSDWVAQRLQLPRSERLADIRLLLRDGSQRQGADVYRYVMRRIWWAWPIYFISILPVLRSLFDYCYRWFVRNRRMFARAT